MGAGKKWTLRHCQNAGGAGGAGVQRLRAQPKSGERAIRDNPWAKPTRHRLVNTARDCEASKMPRRSEPPGEAGREAGLLAEEGVCPAPEITLQRAGHGGQFEWSRPIEGHWVHEQS